MHEFLDFTALLYGSTPRKLKSFLTHFSCGWTGNFHTSSNMIIVTNNSGKIIQLNVRRLTKIT